MYRTVKVTILLTLTTSIVAQEIGERCKLNNGAEGICENINKCDSAKKDLEKKIPPKTCGFLKNVPIVCCDKVLKTSGNPRRISEEKCKIYRNYDTYYEDSKILGGGGVDAEPKQFPHMAILGYGNNVSIKYGCGGSLISEQFVLTAAHCLESRELGPVKVVRIGDLDTASNIDDAEPQDFTIIKQYPHPDYNTDSFYNDVAVLKLDKPVKITTYVKPACLETEKVFKTSRLTATGWGALYYGGDMHNKLQTLDLMNLPKEECLPTYGPQLKLSKGIDEDIQICGGNLKKSVDTCQGDSGGPLQYQIQAIPPVHRIVGVTSFGIHCNLVPGIYTRIYKYIPWIESIVWPN